MRYLLLRYPYFSAFLFIVKHLLVADEIQKKKHNCASSKKKLEPPISGYKYLYKSLMSTTGASCRYPWSPTCIGSSTCPAVSEWV